MSNIIQEIKKLTKDYPRFDDGRIDYTHARACPVVNCTVIHGDKVLLTHRSEHVIAYPNTWNGISGFIDRLHSLEKTILTELEEEANITREHIKNLHIFDKIIQIDNELDREWHMFPAVAELTHKPDISINWENKHAEWVHIDDVLNYELVPCYVELFELVKSHLAKQAPAELAQD